MAKPSNIWLCMRRQMISLIPYRRYIKCVWIMSLRRSIRYIHGHMRYMVPRFTTSSSKTLTILLSSNSIHFISRMLKKKKLMLTIMWKDAKASSLSLHINLFSMWRILICKLNWHLHWASKYNKRCNVDQHYLDQITCYQRRKQSIWESWTKRIVVLYKKISTLKMRITSWVSSWSS